MVWTDPGSLSTASLARTRGRGNIARSSRPTRPCRHTSHRTCRRKVRARSGALDRMPAERAVLVLFCDLTLAADIGTSVADVGWGRDG